MDSSSIGGSLHEKGLSAEGAGLPLSHFFTFAPSPSSTSKNHTGCKKQTSLDKYKTKLAVSTGSRHHAKKGKTWGKKQRRAYHRALSGIQVAHILGKRLRFITLTTAHYARKKDLNKDFENLKKRIRRKYGKFEYFKIRTSEGYGVLHILYRGTFISQKWLSKTWSKLHPGTKIVDIRLVRRRKKRLARYLVTQYIAGHTFTRLSWSWRWVFKGFVRLWRSLVKRYRGKSFEKGLAEWRSILSQHCYKQQTIYNYLSEKPPPGELWRYVTDEWWRSGKKRCAVK